MSLARRLLMSSGGSGAFAPPTLNVDALVAAPDGAWSHIGDPRAVYVGGKTIFGYVGGTSGNVELRSYDHATDTVSAATVLAAALGGAEGNPDHHDNPALLVRSSDGKLVTAYSGHDAPELYVRISSNAAPDISSFAAATNIDASVGGSDYTYPALEELTDEGAIYLFYRDLVSGEGRLAYTKSTDNGATWSARTILFAPGASRTAYWKVAGNGTDRIDVIVTDGSPPNESAPVKVYHCYLTGGNIYKSDGTQITASLPLAPSNLTTVYSDATGRAWPWDAIIRDTGYPQFVLQIVGAADNTIRDYRWNGSAWVGTDITTTDGVWVANISPGAGIDQREPDTVYVLKKVSGTWELFRYVTTDDGASWTGTAITTSSASNNLSVSTVRDHTGLLPLVWFHGTYTDYLTYSTGIKGLVLR